MLTGLVLIAVSYCAFWALFALDHKLSPALGLLLAIASTLTGAAGCVMFVTASFRVFMTVML